MILINFENKYYSVYMSELNTNNNETMRGPSIKYLKNMGYLEILEHYIEYPQKNLKFNCVPRKTTKVSDNPDSVDSEKINAKNKSVKKVNFLGEKDKADGWIQNYSNNTRFSKFFVTNLHYLPEHLWTRLKPVYHEQVHVGYKVRDKNVYFFVHEAEVDNLSRSLFDAIAVPSAINKEYVSSLIHKLNNQEIDDCWLTIKANRLINA